MRILRTSIAVHDNEYTPAPVVAEVRFLALPIPPASSAYPACPTLFYAVLYRLVLYLCFLRLLLTMVGRSLPHPTTDFEINHCNLLYNNDIQPRGLP